MKFSKGQNVYFRRNSVVCSESTPVIACDEKNNVYLLENEYGWNPGQERLEKYKLNAKKKYLFVMEDELMKLEDRKKQVQEQKAQEEKRKDELIEQEQAREEQIKKELKAQEKAAKQSAPKAKAKKKKKR